VVGILAAIDQSVIESKNARNDFFARALQKQGARCVGELDKLMVYIFIYRM